MKTTLAHPIHKGTSAQSDEAPGDGKDLVFQTMMEWRGAVMLADLKRYPGMKDFGVEWLGEVPQHWEVRRTKTLLRELSQEEFPNEPMRSLEEIRADILELEKETEGLLGEVIRGEL